MNLSTPISVMSFARGCSLITITACVLLHTSCNRSETSGTQKEPDSDPVAIQIGERKIRLSQLQEEIVFLQQRNSPLAKNSETFIAAAVERLIALEKARELGLDHDIELRRQWENLLIGRLKSKSIDAKLSQLTISESEINDFYKANQKRYSRPAQIHLALLFLKVPKVSDENKRQAIRKRLEDARVIALSQPDEIHGFGSAAMEYSEEATSRFKGGDVGWIKQGNSQYRWPNEVIQVGFSLNDKNSISEVISTPDGYYLLKKIDSREAQVRTLDGRFRSSLESEILKTKRADLVRETKSQWQESVALSINQDVVSHLQFKSLSTAPLEKLSPFPLSN